MEFELDGSLKEWAKDKPLSVLQLDPADRAVLRIADERDAIQKKTFTKWVNKHLKKANRHIGDLFQDLRDGHDLISLLEVLSGEHLPRETSGSMRFHMLDNVRIALRFLHCKNIKFVNIQAEDIVDGNPKLSLGLIWTIILHFQTFALFLCFVTFFFNSFVRRVGSEDFLELDHSEVEKTKRRAMNEHLRERSSVESCKTSRRDKTGARRTVTHIIRKTTTLTRGNEEHIPIKYYHEQRQYSQENLSRSSSRNELQNHQQQQQQHRILDHNEYQSIKQRATPISSQASSTNNLHQISDIIFGQETNVTARDALMQWARKSTARYPGVHVTDFTKSWRDGLALGALVHRNRPDLFDWHTLSSWKARDRLDKIFNIVEHEYGVTRLLDPEDVDTPEPDEKSLITYISSLYDVFPEPPPIHPLYDAEAQCRLSEYCSLADSLKMWIHEKTSVMSDLYYPPTLIEMRKLATESAKFKNEEVPARFRDKQRMHKIHQDLQHYFEIIGKIDLEPELHYDVLDKSWQRLLALHQERDQGIHQEIHRLEKLQRIAERAHREIKSAGDHLAELERKVMDSSHRLGQMHPLEAKHLVDVLEQDIRSTEIQVQNIFTDVHTLTDGKYNQAAELHKRVQKLHQQWVTVRSLLHNRLVQPLSEVSFPVEERIVTKHRTMVTETRLVDTNPFFHLLRDCLEWCKNKIQSVKEADFGSDQQGVRAELERFAKEHQSILDFQKQVENCKHEKKNLHENELALYNQHLLDLQQTYAELVSLSKKRMADLELLDDFIQAATNELVWLNNKEETEITRDWSDKSLDVDAIEKYYEVLMSDLEKREAQFTAVQERGEAIMLQGHPASRTIEAYISAMQSQWAWLLQLTLCLEVHLKYSRERQLFFQQVQEAEQWIVKKNQLLTSSYSQTEFDLDDGEVLLKGMQSLRKELNDYGDHIYNLTKRAESIVPVRQRSEPIHRPIRVTCICVYNQVNILINPNEQCTLYDNSGRLKWKVKNSSGQESLVPGVCFSLQPPDDEALMAVEKLRNQYENSIALWQRKQLRLRQSMIFATIKVVKDWSLQQFIDMGEEQRDAIRRALNEDANKLLKEGDPLDPHLRRLKREISDINRLLDEYRKRVKAEEDTRQTELVFNTQALQLQYQLNEAERELRGLMSEASSWNLPNIEKSIDKHADFEKGLRTLAPEIEKVQQTFRSISLKTPTMKNTVDKIMNKWDGIWDMSNLHIDRLKQIELVQKGIRENKSAIYEIQTTLDTYEKMADKGQNVFEKLLDLQHEITKQQSSLDQLNENAQNVRHMCESAKPNFAGEIDLMDSEINLLNAEWAGICGKLVDQLRASENMCQTPPKMAFANEVYYEKAKDKSEVSTAHLDMHDGKSVKAMMEEKYELAYDSLKELMLWMKEVENSVANQDAIQEDLDSIKKQMNNLKRTKEDITPYAQVILKCLDDINQLMCAHQNDTFREQIENLEKDGHMLKRRYDDVMSIIDKLLKSLKTSQDEYVTFMDETDSFRRWMVTTQNLLEKHTNLLNDLNSLSKNSETIRNFVSNVIAHQADLRFITMVAQKFSDESIDYLQNLNTFRTGLPQCLTYKEHACQESWIGREVSLLTESYKDLLCLSNELSEKFSRLNGKNQEFRDSLSKASAYLNEFEARVNEELTRPITSETSEVEDRLSSMKALHKELLSNKQYIDNCKVSINALMKLLSEQKPNVDNDQIEKPFVAIENKYEDLDRAISNKCQELDTILLKNQGIEETLTNLMFWLNGADIQFKNLNRPVSLEKGHLEEQQREQRLLLADLNNHRASIEAVNDIIYDLIRSSKNAVISKRTENKLEDIKRRFEKLHDKSVQRTEFMNAIFQDVDEYNNMIIAFNRWFSHMTELLDYLDFNKLNTAQYGEKLTQLQKSYQDRKPEQENLVSFAKKLIAKQDVCDITKIRDEIKVVESQWKDMGDSIDEKKRLHKLREDKLATYEKLYNQIYEWLNATENSMQYFMPVAINSDEIKHRLNDLKPILKEYNDYGVTIEKVNDLGVVIDNLINGKSDNYSQRRSVVNVSKRLGMRRVSQDNRSPSPTKGSGVQSPVCSSISSGFSSRRSSQDGFHLESSHIQQQLSEINNRYELLGVRLSDRQAELESMRDELKKCLDNLKQLEAFLEKIQRHFPKSIHVVSKEEANNAIKQNKAILEEMLEKQSLLDNTADQIQGLLKSRSNIFITDSVNIGMSDIARRWEYLMDKSKTRVKFFENIKEFHDVYDNLSSWIVAKENMVKVLGPISSDPRIVASQVQQVQVLREEFRTQQPQFDFLTRLSDNIASELEPDSADYRELKKGVNGLLDKWRSLFSSLEERALLLGDAIDTTREFDNSLNRFRNALQTISDNLDDLSVDQNPENELRKIENLARQLEGERPLLADVDLAGQRLCDVVSDPLFKTDIQGKLQSVKKFYASLQKKLDNKKAEVEGNLRDTKDFETNCSKTLGWLAEKLGSVSEKLLISADKKALQQTFDYYEPLYKEVMSKEHEVVMLLNKGKSIVAKPYNVDNQSLHRDLDKIQSLWDRLKKDIVKRHTRLTTSIEHSQKYHEAQTSLLAWIRLAEEKLVNLKPVLIKYKDIHKRQNDLTAFKNDMLRKSVELDNVCAFGETFMNLCDIDQNAIKVDLNEVKLRWNKVHETLTDHITTLESSSTELESFMKKLKDLEYEVNKYEDKLTFHDSLGRSEKDPKLFEQISNLNEDVKKLVKPTMELQNESKSLIFKICENGVDAKFIKFEVEAIVDRVNNLHAKLNFRSDELRCAASTINLFSENLCSQRQQLNKLEKEFLNMSAPAREINAVNDQLDQTERLMKKIAEMSQGINDLYSHSESLIDQGFAIDATSVRDQVQTLESQLDKLEESGKARLDELGDALDKIKQFTTLHASNEKKIKEISKEMDHIEPIAPEIERIRLQQADFHDFKMAHVEPLNQVIGECNLLGQKLIETAGRDVSTSKIEKSLDTMNDNWNSLKKKLNERDRKLDSGLLNSGKFQEALNSLEKWLIDTEEMVMNQKPISSDYKVIKAQLQEQKFLTKMLLDHQQSMASIKDMGEEMALNADLNDRHNINSRLQNLMGRFENLNETSDNRMSQLERALSVAAQYREKFEPLAKWLERCEGQINDMELIPTDEIMIEKKIEEHDAVHRDLLEHKSCFSDLTDVASTLMSLIGEEEAATLADSLQSLAEGYTNLVERSESLKQMLDRCKTGLRLLVLSYQELRDWMDGIEKQLNQHNLVSQPDKLRVQLEELNAVTEDLTKRQNELDKTYEAGIELTRHINLDEAMQLHDKMDALRRRHAELKKHSAELLNRVKQTLPMASQFDDKHNKFIEWIQAAETRATQPDCQLHEFVRMDSDIAEQRGVLAKLTGLIGNLRQVAGSEIAGQLEILLSRDQRRLEIFAEQITRRMESMQQLEQQQLELAADLYELLEWFREAESQLEVAEPPSTEPEVVRVQLKEHRALNENVNSQRNLLRDFNARAKKIQREQKLHKEESGVVDLRERLEELREVADNVSSLSNARLSALEQALPLAEHFRDSQSGLAAWLTETEQQVAVLPSPTLKTDSIALQQDRNELLLQSIAEHRPLIDKMEKTCEALMALCAPDDAARLQETAMSLSERYAALRDELRNRQLKLEQALQESAVFADKLEGMLRALSNAADQIRSAEPLSAHPPRLRDQIEENMALSAELAGRSDAFEAVQRAATELLDKARRCSGSDPSLRDIQNKVEQVNKLWDGLQNTTLERAKNLQAALEIAEDFWSGLNNVLRLLTDIQDALAAQIAPAAQPGAIEEQQVALNEIRQEIDQTAPGVEQVRQSGRELMNLCGEPDKPEVRKQIEDLDQAWDNITALYARREENLIDAMEKAMEFHETLGDLRAFLDSAEKKFASFSTLGSDTEAIKNQIKELLAFKAETDPYMIKIEALNRQAAELSEKTSSEQAQSIKEPLGAVNRRWEALLKGVVDRQQLLEKALLRLGQFQHALDELLHWIDDTSRKLGELRPVGGDSQMIEVELAKLKVLNNDIHAHQNSVDTLNDAGRQIIEDDKNSAEASSTADKLTALNTRWNELVKSAHDKQREFEDGLLEAQSFSAEIQDFLSWLADIDSAIVSSKPAGGLPETATEQLERFMVLYNELEDNRPKYESIMQRGKEYLKYNEKTMPHLNQNLRTLKQRWTAITGRASDKKIKLEIALKEAKDFNDALQNFVDWLTDAESFLNNLKPVSRIMRNILDQIEDHKKFQKDVGVHRETMLNLDKKGTHLKYFSQKQDVILIKNLLISVQHRWEKVVSKSAERTRALDYGYKEAKEFDDAWNNLMGWLNETDAKLEHLRSDGLGGNDPDKIKARLQKQREVQKELHQKQTHYDATMKCGKVLKERAARTDEAHLRDMMNELKSTWLSVYNKSIDFQRQLEESLLHSGQFKEATQALIDWLTRTEKQLSANVLVHGDLETVNVLLEQFANFESDLKSRAQQMDAVVKIGTELQSKASPDDAFTIRHQLEDLRSLWDRVSDLSDRRSALLEEALNDAEQLHNSMQTLMDWMSGAERRLNTFHNFPEDEAECEALLDDQNHFIKELQDKEKDKQEVVRFANVLLNKANHDGAIGLKHWISVIQARWDDISALSYERRQKLENLLKTLQDLDKSLEELLTWLRDLENNLKTVNSQELPEDREVLEEMITEHRAFMERTAKRQDEVDRICKSKIIRPTIKNVKKNIKAKPVIQSRNYGRSNNEAQLPHIGPSFPSKESREADPEFRHPKVRLLWDLWRNVWFLAWEHQRRLYDQLQYVIEKDRVANFSWEDWRKKFLKFMNHKKSRLTDLLRKMDQNNDGLIPRNDFIQGILNIKFDTSRLEMGAVSDLFDRNGEGLIDWKEFIAALRPDWEERRTAHDGDKIHDEVKRLIMLCTCRQKFRVFQVGEGKYRFGDSQKLRLVRILRSTVMVRVGGGWVALDEFLLKNDPCRIKGRTNIELREQFILADGVSQSMTAFKSKVSPSMNRNNLSSTGPITKVRERSYRSLPMGQSQSLRASLGASTPENLSDLDSLKNLKKTSSSQKSLFSSGSSRPSSRSASRPASRTSSRPPSQQGSRPPSRYGSTQSLNSTDETSIPSRIPRKIINTGDTPTSSRRSSTSGRRGDSLIPGLSTPRSNSSNPLDISGVESMRLKMTPEKTYPQLSDTSYENVFDSSLEQSPRSTSGNKKSTIGVDKSFRL
uniref:Calponin-homology (CH) domain-containing protein n=1 Tax=Trichogramma kaykai TaxID=54128 RepID=A0ABD2XTK8_9HYME